MCMYVVVMYSKIYTFSTYSIQKIFNTFQSAAFICIEWTFQFLLFIYLL